MNSNTTNAAGTINTTTYEVRISSRERPEDSHLVRVCATAAEAAEVAQGYADKGEPVYVRPVWADR